MPRALAYLQYLPEHGCRMFALAPSHPSTPVYDASLLRAIPSETRVVRAFNPEPPFAWRDRLWKRLLPPHRNSGSASPGQAEPKNSSSLKRRIRSTLQRALFPDIQTVWVPFAIRAAVRLVERFDIETVILNVPPFSTLKIGIVLRNQFSHLKIISDFRDDWMGYYVHNFDSPDADRLARCEALERDAVRCSDFVAVATKLWAEQMRTRYPGESVNKFVFVPNGYEPQLFADFSHRQRHDGKMIVAYFGTLYNNRIYSPENYLRAIEQLPDNIREAIETRFVGRITPDAEPLFTNRRATLHRYGFLPKRRGIRLLEDADVLLLIATDPGSHAAKLFDYLGTGKPILALSPCGGEIDLLLRETGAGMCVDPWNVDSIAAALIRCFDALATNRPISTPNLQAIEQYSWPMIMCRFARETAISTKMPAAR